jgi:monoterpene epsilon-lactone hydrolase
MLIYIYFLNEIHTLGVPVWLPTLPSDVAAQKSVHPPGEWFYPKDAGLKVRMNANPKAMSDGKYILYFHGGAFCTCNSATHRDLLFRLVEKTQATIFAVDYRRPPEYPFPAPVDDCISAFLFILEKVGDAKRIVLAGDSAGGNLVITTLLRISELGLPPPAGGVLISPWVDLMDFSSPSWKNYSDIDYLDIDLAKLFAGCYQGTCGTYTMRDLSPTYSDALHTLPPLLIEVGGCEVLHDQIVAFSKKVEKAGGIVTCNVREDMIHVFPIYSFTGMPQCDQAFRDIVQFINGLCPTICVDDFYHYEVQPPLAEVTAEENDTSISTSTVDATTEQTANSIDQPSSESSNTANTSTTTTTTTKTTTTTPFTTSYYPLVVDDNEGNDT